MKRAILKSPFFVLLIFALVWGTVVGVIIFNLPTLHAYVAIVGWTIFTGLFYTPYVGSTAVKRYLEKTEEIDNSFKNDEQHKESIEETYDNKLADEIDLIFKKEEWLSNREPSS